jgi:hypothetical protein
LKKLITKKKKKKKRAGGMAHGFGPEFKPQPKNNNNKIVHLNNL